MRKVSVQLSPEGRVRLAFQAELPVSVASAWDRLRDFERCACLDFFHRDVRLPGPPAPGMRFALPHQVLAVRLERLGEILRWREGRGWAFSDLSKRGPRHGFPHVFSVDLQPLGSGRCALSLRITGLWTARWWPRFVVRPWLRLNTVETGTALAREITAPRLPEPARTPSRWRVALSRIGRSLAARWGL